VDRGDFWSTAGRGDFPPETSSAVTGGKSKKPPELICVYVSLKRTEEWIFCFPKAHETISRLCISTDEIQK
jgi:hypothetical protein